MLKKIGISMAALCAVLALANPPAAAARDRDDDHDRPSYQDNQERRAYPTYRSQERYRNDRGYGNDYWFQDDYRNDRGYGNDYRNDRRAREWREHEWREQRERESREQRRRWNHRDRDDDYRYQR